MKRRLAITFLCFSMIVSLLSITAVASSDLKNAVDDFDDLLVAQIAIGKDTIQYSVDAEGNIFGPSDFCISDDAVYVLDSNDNKIIEIQNNSIIKVVYLNKYGITATNIAVSGNDLYILGNNITAYRLNALGTLEDIGISSYLMSEGISDFRIIDNFLYVCVAEHDITTYIFDLSNGKKAELVGNFTGMVFDSETVYYSKPVSENDNPFGNAISMTITDLRTDSAEVVDIYSDYTALGAQYLGKDDNGNNRIVFFEIAQNHDNTLAVSTNLRIVDRDGNTVGIRELRKQVKSIPNQAKSYNGKVYYLNNQEDRVEVLCLGDPSKNSVSEYSSPLADILQPSPSFSENADTQSSRSTISRDTIMTTAVSYHTSYSWTCSSGNVSPMTGWVCPSYVNGAGTYSCMPYCWGKFDNQANFEMKLGWGYRVGQATSTYIESTCGLDCAGYVSRCWGLSTHHYTGALPGISSEIPFASLQRGDALNSSNHVMLFDYCNSSNGTYILYECTTTSDYDRVAHTIRTASSVQSVYTALKYNNVA